MKINRLILIFIMLLFPVQATYAWRPPIFPIVDYPSYSWMHPDLKEAWSNNYRGQGATVYVIDDFNYSWKNRFSGKLTDGKLGKLPHGQWVSDITQLVAPEAIVTYRDFNTTQNIALDLNTNIKRPGLENPRGFYIINMSYRLPRSTSQAPLDPLSLSAVEYAKKEKAVVVMAAGNDGTRYKVGSVDPQESCSKCEYDVLGLALIGAKSAIFVGELLKNGTAEEKVFKSRYSQSPGSDVTVQNQYVMVGVDREKMGGLAGTSFAAPIVSGYAAILSSKFRTATPTQVVNQLLTTARTDTIKFYSSKTHGRGEASLSRALAPQALK